MATRRYYGPPQWPVTKDTVKVGRFYQTLVHEHFSSPSNCICNNKTSRLLLCHSKSLPITSQNSPFELSTAAKTLSKRSFTSINGIASNSWHFPTVSTLSSYSTTSSRSTPSCSSWSCSNRFISIAATIAFSSIVNESSSAGSELLYE